MRRSPALRIMVPVTLRHWLTSAGMLTARPAAFVILGVYTLSWLIISPETLEWHSAATLATWLMTLFIQRAEHRDTQAIQAKLDELLRAQSRARSDLAGLDAHEPEEIEKMREAERSRDNNAPPAGLRSE